MGGTLKFADNEPAAVLVKQLEGIQGVLDAAARLLEGRLAA